MRLLESAQQLLQTRRIISTNHLAKRHLYEEATASAGRKANNTVDLASMLRRGKKMMCLGCMHVKARQTHWKWNGRF